MSVKKVSVKLLIKPRKKLQYYGYQQTFLLVIESVLQSHF